MVFRDEDVERAVRRYAVGAFPMDDELAPELPWYVAPQRAILPLEDQARDRLRRKVRRDVRRCEDHVLAVDRDYDQVLRLCAQPPTGDGIWITERLAALYRRLHAAGVAHSFELWTPAGELAAGILGVVLGRAALLESMRRTRPGAGNALLVRTLDHLVASGIELCDIQLPTPHTERLGCVLIEHADYEARLVAALRG
ncbi:MAG: leucyl/phenylalanyl-tRNA--protein transferase [Solirubrobacterales bacterium]|nr:leucyl/phenylalanyl-tRNA--protein transferase [Solirubrobacterales bacterium]